MAAKNPRRAVVSVSRPVLSSRHHNYWDCKLACGHTVTAYGIRKNAADNYGEPPKTVGCHHCAREAKNPTNGS